MPVASGTEPPGPDGAHSFDELGARLRALLAWSGVSYRELHRRIVQSRRARGMTDVPVYNTVYRCLQPGRRRMDVELVADIVRALLDDETKVGQWRQAHRLVTGQAADSAMATVAGALPDGGGDVIGRRAELDALLDLGGDATCVVIGGMAGVGKTTLALRVAHELVRRGRAGDVRLWADLRGYEAERAPADPAAVLDGFLRQLGAPSGQLHRLSMDGRVATYQELLAGRRGVLVLDNAATEQQVRPLLPNTPGCLVLVTSRRRLAGLAGARRVCLDVFSPAESMELLRRTVGAATIEADAGSAARIAELVGHLPLALAVVASRIRSSPGWELRDHAARLAERRTGLRVEDETATAVGLSYMDISGELQRLLRLLAIHPGRDFDSRACAALAGAGHATVAQWLDSLVAGHLVQRRGQDRFGLHDVVRVFAAGMARDVDPASAKAAALRRLLGYYRHAAAVAMDHYAPHERDRRPELSTADVPVPELTGRASATAWLDAERQDLVALAVHAGELGWPDEAAALSPILVRYLHTSAHYRDAEILHKLALRASDRLARAHAYRSLGAVCMRTDRYTEGVVHLRHALAIFDEASDRRNWARALQNLGACLDRLGEYQEALGCHQRAVAVFEETGDRIGEARALGNLGLVCLQLGRTEEAASHFQRTLAIVREVGDRNDEAQTIGNLGLVYQRQGRGEQALECYRRYVDTAREIGFVGGEADALHHLGSGYRQAGRDDLALTHYERALALARDAGIGEVEMRTLNDLGCLLRLQGDVAAALARHREALALAENVGDRYAQARAHDGIAQSRAAAGERAAAEKHWRRALALHTELGTPEADVIAACLDSAERMSP